MPASKKLILIDLDGTLLNSRSEISSRNKEIIEKLISLNHYVIIATGRNYSEARQLTSKIDNLGYITSNGSYIIDKNSNVILSEEIKLSSAKKVLKLLAKYKKIAYYISSGEEIITDNKFNLYKNFFFATRHKLKYRKRLLASLFKIISKFKLMDVKGVNSLIAYLNKNEFCLHKIFVLGDKKQIEIASHELQNKFLRELNISSSGENNIEINAAGVSKGKALEYLCQELDFPITETIAFGDGENDLELFEKAGTAVVMANSSSELLKAASDIETLSNDEDGVAVILNQILSDDSFLIKKKNDNKIKFKSI